MTRGRHATGPRRPGRRLAAVLGAALPAASVSGFAGDADLALAGANDTNGRALIAEHRCNGGCHQSHAEDNDPLTLYLRENRKVRSAPALVNMVQYCAVELELQLFPEDVTDIAAVLNRDYYKFP